MNQKEEASLLGITPGALSKRKKKGSPVGNIGASKTWEEQNVAPRYKANKAVTNIGNLPPPETAPTEADDTWQARLGRARANERESSRQLQRVIKGGMILQIPVLLKAHSSAVEAVATAEKLASDARLHTGELIHRETVRAIMRELLAPLREALDKLPIGERTNCNPDHPEIAQRALTEWRDKLLARGNAIEARF